MPATNAQVLRGLLLAAQLAVFILLTCWIFGYLGGVSLRPVKAGFAAGSNDTNRSASLEMPWHVDRIVCLQASHCPDIRSMFPGYSTGIPY